jgi:iron complex outermembrane receptor protein
VPAPPSPPGEEWGARAHTARPAGPGEIERNGTGSKINAPLEELPLTISVVDRRTLDERGSVDLQQALSVVPGVVPLWTYGGFQYITSRGFQAMTLFDGRRDSRAAMAGSAPQVGIYDLERIEVLRGPSSVLYGYGAVGGVVNLVRRRPSLRQASELELGLGLPNQRRVHAGAQGALGSLLSYRVDLGHVAHQDFRDARTIRDQATTALRFTPTRNNAFNLRLAYARDRYDTDVGIPTVESSKRPGQWVLPPHVDRSNRYSGRHDHLAYERIELSLDYRYEISRSTYVEARTSAARDHYDYLAAESLTYLKPTGEQRAQVAREYLYFARGWRPLFASVELHSELTTGPVRHQLVTGYTLDHFSGKSDRSDLGGAQPAPVDYANPVDRSARPPVALTAYDHYRHVVHSLYGFDHIHLLPELILTGGGRLDFLRSRTRREFLDGVTREEVPDPSTGELRKPNRVRDFNSTGQAGLVYTLIAPLTVYASYANAYRPLFVSPSASSVTRYEPELSQQFEGGLRVRVERSAHAFDVDAAGYLIRKKNLLVPRGVDDFNQAGLAQSRGLDLSLSYRAPRFVQLDAGYALIDAQYLKYVGPSALSGENISYKGNVLQYAPRHSGTAWLRFLPVTELQLAVGTRVMGEQWADDENRLRMPRYALLDASLMFGNERARFVISATNLLDTHGYYSSAINEGSLNPQVTPGPGRELLGTLRLTL